ncbi:MAG: CcoQ/FixQ family Cbb3-type cytochrome c oxidase assembly chaperone [Sphingobacteriales bacterium]|nr:CcoQ/FixQ family Cbb3-type cytochrome c oxidase assembly chaperone [Sphingobacteriales bacterium]MCC7222374.1 CcoQ/FixQ family Cbb3-type cytochrome c oxidase assembly chaperone [Chitinophagales bacterium]
MKFSTYLEQIVGVSLYPIISLVLFVAFFALVTAWVYSTDSRELARIAQLPLDE